MRGEKIGGGGGRVCKKDDNLVDSHYELILQRVEKTRGTGRGVLASGRLKTDVIGLFGASVFKRRRASQKRSNRLCRS